MAHEFDTATHVFDPNQNRVVPRAHPVGPYLTAPDHKPDPSHVKRPATFWQVGGLNVSGEVNGCVLFTGTGRITRAAMRDLVSLFQAWDDEEDL